MLAPMVSTDGTLGNHSHMTTLLVILEQIRTFICLLATIKSEQSSSVAQIKESNFPEGWTDLGPYCLHYREYDGEEGRVVGEAHEVCETYGSELMSWKDRSEYFPLKIF